MKRYGIRTLVAAAALAFAAMPVAPQTAGAQGKAMNFEEEMEIETGPKPPPKKEEPKPKPEQVQKAPAKGKAKKDAAEQPQPVAQPVPAPPPEEKKPAFRGTISFDEVDVMAASPDKDKMDRALTDMKKGEFAKASVAFYEILQNQQNVEFFQAAEYNLAKCLYRMGLYHSSLLYFRQVLAKGPSHKFFQSSLEWLFHIAHKVKNEATILDTVASLSQYEFPPKYQDEFHLLLAKYFFLRNNNDEVRKFAARIPENSPFSPKARYLEALVLYKENKLEDSLKLFREVAKMLNPRGGQYRDDDLRKEAFLQLARIHYQAGQFKNAIFYYDKFTSGSDDWLEALYESSWAYFQLDEQEKALGNLVTLDAPFFRDEFFPEMPIIKAVIYYDNCRYAEANQFVAAFLEKYVPIFEELTKVTQEQLPPDQYYEYLSKIQQSAGKAGTVKAKVLASALSDPDIKKYNDSIRELEAELERFGKTPKYWRESGLDSSLASELRLQEKTLATQAGTLTKARLGEQRDMIKELIAQGYRIQLETQTKEKEVLEARLRGEEMVTELTGKKFVTSIDPDHLYWPFTGEYWRDELGTYHYTMMKGCRQSAK